MGRDGEELSALVSRVPVGCTLIRRRPGRWMCVDQLRTDCRSMEVPVWNSEDGLYQLSYLMLTDIKGHEAMSVLHCGWSIPMHSARQCRQR